MTAESIQVKVLFFASAREAAGGTTETQVVLPAAHATTTALRQRLAQDYPSLASMVLDEDSITLALNEEYVGAGQVLDLKSGDCVALIPPISGG
jgi:molybdopterin converting factor subunit 1